MIRTCAKSDALQLVDIYNHYVRETIVTFEEETVSANEMKARIKSCSAVLPWLLTSRKLALNLATGSTLAIGALKQIRS